MTVYKIRSRNQTETLPKKSLVPIALKFSKRKSQKNRASENSSKSEKPKKCTKSQIEIKHNRNRSCETLANRKLEKKLHKKTNSESSSKI